MRIKITSTHRAKGNLPVQDLYIGISEFYVNIDTNTVSLRTSKNTIFENEEFPVSLMESDPLYACIHQNREIVEWASDVQAIQLSGTRYQIQAQILFELIFKRIADVNAITPNTITYELVGFPS